MNFTTFTNTIDLADSAVIYCLKARTRVNKADTPSFEWPHRLLRYPPYEPAVGDEQREKLRGSQPITAADFLRIPEILTSPDKIENGRKSPAGLDTIKYSKRFNGSVIYLEEVRRKRHDLALVRMYKKSSKDDQSPKPSVSTSETTLAYPQINKEEIEKQVSKVVDENGEPLVVYHASPQGDVEFTERERGIFFTSSKKLADGYASSRFFRGGNSPLPLESYA